MPPQSLNAPFGRLTLPDVNRLLGAAMHGYTQRVQSRWFLPAQSFLRGWTPINITRSFLAGDHWQGSWGWIGPRPQPTDPAYAETMTELERQFVSKNVIGEMVGRHVNGVLGIEPSWGLTPIEAVPEGEDVPAATQTLIDEAEALLTVWWDDRQMGRLLQEVAVTLLYAERAMLRLYIPRGLLVENEEPDPQNPGQTRRTLNIEATDFADALNHIWPDHPLPEYSTVTQDEDTKQYVGVVYFTRQENIVTGQAATEEHADLTYLDGDRSEPETVIRTVMQNLSVEFRFDLNGLLPMYEAERPLFVTPQLWQAQRALNLALTLLPRSVVTSGFLERTIFNAQMPGEWEVDENGQKTRFIPAPYYVGAGVTNILRGIELEDQNTGRTQIATPTIHHREPSDTAPVIQAARAHYLDMLEEGSQEHVLANQDSQASGKSIEQTRASFVTSLRMTQQQVEPMGRWLIMTLLAMAEAFTGQIGHFTDTLRAQFSCHLDAGPISAEERAANEAAVKAGTMSRQTAILRNGEVDPDAELARITAQPDASLGIIERQTAVIKMLTDAGANLRGAAAFAGLEDDEIEELLALPDTTDPDSPENQPQGNLLLNAPAQQPPDAPPQPPQQTPPDAPPQPARA